MAFWLTLFLFVGFTIVGELLRPKPKFGAPTPSSLGDFQVPTAQEGRPIPVVFGTVRLKGPNVTWYGALNQVAIKKKVKTGLFTSTKVTVGFHYHLGQQLVLCHGPIDALLDMRMDDRPLPITTKIGTAPSGTYAGATDMGPGNFWSGSDGGTALHTYVDEDPPNDLDNIGEFGGSAWSLCGLQLAPMAAPPAGVPIYVGFRVRRNPTWGSLGQFRFKLISGSTTVKDVLVTPTLFYGTYALLLSAAEVALISDWSNLKVEFFAQGSPLNTAYIVSWIRLYSTASLAVSPDAWDSEGKMRGTVNQPTLFGGDDREGGVVGDYDFYRGSLNQNANDYLQAKIGATLPAYRGIAYVVARDVYVGNSAYLKQVSFTVRRCPNGLGVAGGRHNVNGDANPACIIYDILTDQRWGCGVPTAQIDAASFLAAADTLYSEGLGLSLVFDNQATARDWIAEVLRHVDGTMYVDPATGLFRIALARGDYQTADLLLLDKSNVKSCKIARPSWEQTTNRVWIHYIDRDANFTPRVRKAEDLANIEARGGEVSEDEFDFRGFSNAAAAQRAAARVIRTVSYPLAPIELRGVNREAWQLRPGGLFRLNWEETQDMACRVIQLRDGDLRSGEITIDAVEDVFGILWTAFTTSGGSSWVDPVQVPGAFAAQRLVEVPYPLVVGPQRVVMTLAAAGSPAPSGYQVWSDPTGATNYARTNDVLGTTPSGTLAGDAVSGGVGYRETSLTVVAGPGMELLQAPGAVEFSQGSAVLLIDDEMIGWSSINNNGDGTYTIYNLVRGVMDTTPVPHLGGSRVWFVTEGAGTTQNSALDADTTVRAKLLGFNGLSVQALDDVPEVSTTTNQRAARPYVPTAVLANGLSYPQLPITGNLTVSWAHRNRLGTWIYDDAGTTATPEAGTTCNLRLYGEDGTLKKTYTGLTGTSQEWTTEVADSGLGRLNSVVRFELEAVVGGLVSYQLVNFTVYRDIFVPVWARDSQRPLPRRRPRVVRVRNTEPGE